MMATNVARTAKALFIAFLSVFFNSAMAVEYFIVDDQRDLPDLDTMGDTRCVATPEGTCTLRAAIDQSNATPGLQIIIMNPGIYEVEAGFTITDTVSITGDPRFHQQDPSGSVEIVVREAERQGSNVLFNITGPTRLGADSFSVSGSANSAFRTALDSELALFDVEVLNFTGPSFGGGSPPWVIANHGIAKLRRVQIIDTGGLNPVGLFNTGLAELNEVTIAGTSRGRGSRPRSRAMVNVGSFDDLRTEGKMIIKNSTIGPDNMGRSGACLYNSSGDVEIYNSTISGNGDRQGGLDEITQSCIVNVGNIPKPASLFLANTTVTDNIARWSTLQNTQTNGVPGALVLLGMKNTVIAGNSVRGCSGVYMISYGFNLIDPECDAEIGTRFNAGTDIVEEDPLLEPLADNGGVTLTHAPTWGSRVVDGGHLDLDASDFYNCEPYDQTGRRRPSSAPCDIGAVESSY